MFSVEEPLFHRSKWKREEYSRYLYVGIHQLKRARRGRLRRSVIKWLEDAGWYNSGVTTETGLEVVENYCFRLDLQERTFKGVMFKREHDEPVRIFIHPNQLATVLEVQRGAIAGGRFSV